MRAPTPCNESDRLAALLHCAVLDSPPQPAFDGIVRFAGQFCDAPIALVSLVAADRQWFKARVGLDVAEAPRDVSFCAHAIHSADVLVVRDTLDDDRFADNPFVQGDPNICLYVGAMPAAEALVSAQQACTAVGRAHAVGVVHRDLKPTNLFLTHGADGAPLLKVLDFGVSKLTAASGPPDCPRVTQGSALLGSPYSMAPEPMRGSDDVDGRADIWSLGVIVFELVSRALPFEGDSFPEVCAAVLSTPARTLAERGIDAPPGLDALLARCFATDRAERYPTAEAFAAARATVGRPATVGPRGPSCSCSSRCC